MKVSIVIPALNEEKWIEKTLHAVLTQDYPDYEIIVVNNASTDNTQGVVESMQKQYPQIKLVQELRPGVLMAREAGRIIATGDIIAQLDADCIPKKNWLSVAVPLFRNRDIVGVVGTYDYYDANWFQRYGTSFLMGLLPTMNAFVHLLKKRSLCFGGNMFIRASALHDAGGYKSTSAFYAEEIDTADRISRFGKIIYSSKIRVKSSARRHKAWGFWNAQKKYNQNTISVFKKTVEIGQETIHPR